jgi:hypothetical protein
MKALLAAYVMPKKRRQRGDVENVRFGLGEQMRQRFSSQRQRRRTVEVAFDVVEELVRGYQAQRGLRSGSPTRYASMIWSIVHGVASLALNQRLDESDIPARMARDATDAFLSGLAPQ